MNKAELIEAMMANENAEFESKAQAERALTAVLDGIKDGLKKDNQVQLIGFGTFQVKERGARKGRNPKTREEMKIPASKSVGFKVGKALKDAVSTKGKKKR